jgi:Leucine-rich repeat (LRR) protein
MNRSYQHSYLMKNVSKQQTMNSITEVETLNPPSRTRENIEGSTTDIIFPRAIDRIGGAMGNQHRSDYQDGNMPAMKRPGKAITEPANVVGYRIVDDDEWHKISRAETKRRKPTKKHDKTLCDMLRKSSTALDNNGKLNLVSCYITEIDRLPDKLSQRVKTLYLSHNSLPNISGLQQFSNLSTVSIANNSIRYLDALVPLTALTKLEKLTLEGNVVTTMPYYREIVLGLTCMDDQIGLVSLDGVRVTPEEKASCRVQYRKAAIQMEQMRCNGLRVAVLDHIEGMTRCHAEIVTNVVGRFR